MATLQKLLKGIINSCGWVGRVLSQLSPAGERARQARDAAAALKQIAEKKQIDMTTLRLAAEIYKEFNMPEKEIHELIKTHMPGILEIGRDMQTIKELVASGALISFKIHRCATNPSSTHSRMDMQKKETSTAAATSSPAEVLTVEDKFRKMNGNSTRTGMRKRAPRFPGKERVKLAYKLNTEWQEAEGINLSRTGVLLETPEPLPASEEIKLKLRNYTNAEDVILGGKIVRKAESMESLREDERQRYGIKFSHKLPRHPRSFFRFM